VFSNKPLFLVLIIILIVAGCNPLSVFYTIDPPDWMEGDWYSFESGIMLSISDGNIVQHTDSIEFDFAGYIDSTGLSVLEGEADTLLSQKNSFYSLTIGNIASLKYENHLFIHLGDDRLEYSYILNNSRGTISSNGTVKLNRLLPTE
jgi:hypothetical protein